MWCAVQEVSTALGYTLHMVALLSKYLQVPLRYLPELAGSRSRLKDDVLPHMGASPPGVRVALPVCARRPCCGARWLVGALRAVE